MAATQHDLDLPAEPASVRQARRFVDRALADVGAGSLAEVAGLLVSELVTNAVIHAGGVIRVRLSAADEVVRVGVQDTSTQRPTPRLASSNEGTGRGLALVADLAQRWGVDDTPDGKEVWFELRP